MSIHHTDHTGFYTESATEREEREASLAGMLDTPLSPSEAFRAAEEAFDPDAHPMTEIDKALATAPWVTR